MCGSPLSARAGLIPPPLAQRSPFPSGEAAERQGLFTANTGLWFPQNIKKNRTIRRKTRKIQSKYNRENGHKGAKTFQNHNM